MYLLFIWCITSSVFHFRFSITCLTSACRLVSLHLTSSSLTHVHGKVDTQVDILGPHIVGGGSIQDREDAAVQVSLASCLGITGHSDDGGTGPVPGQQVGGPAQTQKHTAEHLYDLTSFTFWVFSFITTSNLMTNDQRIRIGVGDGKTNWMLR